MTPLETLLSGLIAATALAIVLMLLFVSARLLASALADARQRAFDRRWEPVLYGWMDGDRPAPPPLPRRHRLWLLRLWNRTRSYVEGEAADGLRQLAAGVDLAGHAAALLRARPAWKRILAALTLGELRSAPHWRELHALLEDRRSAVVLAAVEAMVRIDARRAAPLVVPALLARPHWDPVRAGRLLRVLGVEAVAPLAAALKDAPPGAATRTLAWLGQTEQHEVLDPLRARLRGNASAGEVATILEALGRLGDAGDRELALPYLAHADWHVRSRAAGAIGQLGLPGDRAALEALLADPVWWVRYRAAGALVQLRGATPAQLRTLAEGHPDRFARDVLLRVLAERALP